MNGYCQSLALELVRRGHEVAWVCGGSVRSRVPFLRRCGVRRHPDWRGVRVFEVINSPVAAPGAHQFHDPEGEIASIPLERVFGRLIDWLGPDVVHFHNVEGFTAGVVRRAARGDGGRPPKVVFSLHNYHPVCPEVYLTWRHVTPCENYENGHKCPECAPVDLPRGIGRRKGRSRVAGPSSGRAWEVIRGTRVVKSRHDVEGAFGEKERGGRGGGGAGAREMSLAFYDPGAPRSRPFDNVARPEPASDRAPNAYARRRRAMVEALNSCDQVLAVSEFVRRKYVLLGVDAERIARMSIGTRHVEIAERARPLLPARGGSPEGLLRLAFLGFNLPQKGLGMALDALELLTPELLSRVELHAYGRGIRSLEPRLSLLATRLGGMETRRGYEAGELPFLLARVDVGLVPSAWWDAGPQTVFEFFANGIPVLGAEAGGIPDFVRDGENGLLFRANDRYDLARCMARLVREPSLPGRLREGVSPPKTIEEHAGEVVELYRSLVSCPSRGDSGRERA